MFVYVCFVFLCWNFHNGALLVSRAKTIILHLHLHLQRADPFDLYGKEIDVPALRDSPSYG